MAQNNGRDYNLQQQRQINYSSGSSTVLSTAPRCDTRAGSSQPNAGQVRYPPQYQYPKADLARDGVFKPPVSLSGPIVAPLQYAQSGDHQSNHSTNNDLPRSYQPPANAPNAHHTRLAQNTQSTPSYLGTDFGTGGFGPTHYHRQQHPRTNTMNSGTALRPSRTPAFDETPVRDRHESASSSTIKHPQNARLQYASQSVAKPRSVSSSQPRQRHEHQLVMPRASSSQISPASKNFKESETLRSPPGVSSTAAGSKRLTTAHPGEPHHTQPQRTVDQAQAASSIIQSTNSSAAPGSILEEQMRAMFAKMREFNAQDPEMLSRLWQQERNQHLATENNKQQKPEPSAAAVKAGAPNSKPAGQSLRSDTGFSKEATVSPTSANSHQNRQSMVRGPEAVKTSTSNNHSTKAKPDNAFSLSHQSVLASTASHLLNSFPENKGKQIEPASIAKMLDSRPSYLELCERLEGKGLKLDRKRFARLLLKAFPNADKATAADSNHLNGALTDATSYSTSDQPKDHIKHPETSLVTTTTKPQVVDLPPDSRAKVPKLAADRSGSNEVSHPASTHLEGLDAVKAFNELDHGVDSVLRPTQTKSKPKNRSHVIVSPPTKAAQARKRDFGDLVDLTQDGSDEDKERPTKRLEVSSPDGNVVRNQPISAGSDARTLGQLPLQGKSPGPSAHGQPSKDLPNMPLASPESKDNQSTPPAPRIPKDHPVHTVPLVHRLDKHHARRRSAYSSKTIARDVLLACGRHPEMRHLNAHLEMLKQLFQMHKVKDDADLNTIRWDVLDCGGPEPGSGAVQDFGIDNEDFADDEGNQSDADSVIEQPRVFLRQAVGSLGPAASHLEVQHQTARADPKKGITTRPTDGGVRRMIEQNKIPSSNPQAQSLTRAAGSNTSGYAALRAAQQAQEGQTPRRGRPVGWRKWMQQASADTPGKPSKLSSAQDPPRPPSPTYQVYACEWQDCKAQLHNLDTLRRHVHKMHCKMRAPMERSNDDARQSCQCLWGNCGKAVAVKDGPRTVSRYSRHSFPGTHMLKDHVEEEHLKPVAWKLGDGPTGGLSDRGESAGELSEAYMSDSAGRHVTPRVEMPESAAAAAAAHGRGEGAGTTPHAAFSKPDRKRTAEDAARIDLYSAQERRRRLGPGVDAGGAKMATDKRRHGFIDDEDKVEIVDDD